MSTSTSASAKKVVDEAERSLVEDSDLPLMPREGLTSLLALAVMMVTVGVAIDHAEWAGRVVGGGSQTGFLPLTGLLAVLVGTVLAKTHYSDLRIHFIGALLGAGYLLVSIAGAVSTAPSIEERLRALNVSVATWVNEVVVMGVRSAETSVFLLVLGSLLWAAGLFAARAVFRARRPLPAIVLAGTLLMINVLLTVRDEYIHVVAFVAAALLLVVRLNLLDQAREWRARGMRDVSDFTSVLLRQGAIFIAVAVVASITLAANASSAPLSRAWNNFDEQLLEVGYEVNRWLGGVSGTARGPNVLFTPNQTIREVWESSSDVVMAVTTSDGDGYRWRGATYDSFDGRTWAQLDREPNLVGAGDQILGPTADRVASEDGRTRVTVTVIPADYGGSVFVAPQEPLTIDKAAEVVTNGPAGPFVLGRLVDGIETDVAYQVESSVRVTSGRQQITAADLAAASRSYPAWLRRYVEVQPDSVGPVVAATARQIVASLPANRRDAYHVAEAVQDYLHASGNFTYRTDVRGMCTGEKLVDCFLRIRQGYCEYFATSMVMLLRTLEIPSRYVLGYLPGQVQGDGSYVVDRGAAHAWVEVYFPGYGWIEFDPTPGNAENGQEPTHLSPVPPGSSFEPVPFPGQGESEFIDDPRAGAGPPEFPEPPPPVAATPNTWGALVLGALAVVALLALAVLAYLRRLPRTEPELAYSGVQRLAARLGYAPRPAQTAYEFTAGLAELVPLARGDLELIATAKVEATYARRQPGESLLLSLAAAYRRVRLGLLRLLWRRPRFLRRPRWMRR